MHILFKACLTALQTLITIELVLTVLQSSEAQFPHYLHKLLPIHRVSNTQSAQPVQTSVDTFKHGIKRDPSLFMTFRDGKLFDSWPCSTMALACAQDVAEILDPSHVPVTQDDKDLFQEKQKYMFAVFDQTLLTDTGKALVCEHENDFDAQKIYLEIVKFYLKSTKASLDSSNLLSYITSVCLGSGM